MRAAAAGRAVLSAALLLSAGRAAAATDGLAREPKAADERRVAGPMSAVAGAMLDRPLFSPTRRPPPPALPLLAPSAAPPAPPSAPNVALSGVIVGPTGGGVALVRGPLDPAPVRVRLGGTVDGWTVSEIRPRAVVLRRDGRSATVALPGVER